MKKWIKAARLRTLPLSVSGIIVGTAVAYKDYQSTQYFFLIFFLCLITTLFFQVLSNYANDYGDAKKGTDNEYRVGPKRTIQSGEISLKEMKIAIAITSFLSFVSSILVVYYSFGYNDLHKVIIYIFLALACIGAAIKYTMGKSAYGYRGLGDVFVFIFFGLVGTLATYYLYAHTLVWQLFFPAAALGFFSTAVLNMNNMRDVENDARMNKNTIVVKMGFQNAKKYQYSLIFLAMLSFFIFGVLTFTHLWQYLIYTLYIPFFLHIKKVKQTTIPKELDTELKKIALNTFAISIAYLLTQIL